MPQEADHEDAKLAVNCCVPPTVSVGVAGVTVTAATVTVADPEFAPDVEVTVQDSAFVVAEKKPADEIDPEHPELTVQVEPDTEDVNCCVPDFGMVAVDGDTVMMIELVGIRGLSGPSAALIAP